MTPFPAAVGGQPGGRASLTVRLGSQCQVIVGSCDFPPHCRAGSTLRLHRPGSLFLVETSTPPDTIIILDTLRSARPCLLPPRRAAVLDHRRVLRHRPRRCRAASRRRGLPGLRGQPPCPLPDPCRRSRHRIVMDVRDEDSGAGGRRRGRGAGGPDWTRSSAAAGYARLRRRGGPAHREGARPDGNQRHRHAAPSLRAALPHLRRARAAPSSSARSAGRAPIPFQSHYSASKAALRCDHPRPPDRSRARSASASPRRARRHRHAVQREHGAGAASGELGLRGAAGAPASSVIRESLPEGA